jgi:hypothetical protein
MPAPAIALDSLPSSLTVRPWPDAVLDGAGFDPRSPYVERFWLAVLGPSSVLFLRRLAHELEEHPAGVELAVEDTARSLGLGTRGGRHAPLLRTLARCCQFRLTHFEDGDATLLARRKLPPLNRWQVLRLPAPLQDLHQSWEADRSPHPDVERMRRRARHLALSLLELGEDVEAAERQLHRWRFHPALSREATAWAWHRHRQAQAAADGFHDPQPPEPPDPPIAA